MTDVIGLCVVGLLGTVLCEASGEDSDVVAASIMALPTTPTPLTTRVIRVHTGSLTTSGKQKRRASPKKRNRHLKKISKRSLRSTMHPLLCLAHKFNYTVTGRIEITDYVEIKQHVELLVRGGFRVYFENDDVKFFAFLGNLNKIYPDTIITPNPLKNIKSIYDYRPPCDMVGIVTKSVNGKWIYENTTVTLKEGDTVNYRLLIANTDGSFRTKVHQYFTVRKINGTFVPETPYREKRDKCYVDIF